MKRITIVGMGESRNDFVLGSVLFDSAKIINDSEIWAINFMAGVIRCDKMFAMDSFADPLIDDDNISYPAGHIQWLRDSQFPIISCEKVEGFNIIEYPLEAVKAEFGGFAYFNNTVAYAVALAIHQGANEILLFGCDYSYPNAHKAEQGRGCVEFWLGVAVARGINVVVAASSSLLDQNTGRKLYAYPETKGETQ